MQDSSKAIPILIAACFVTGCPGDDGGRAADRPPCKWVFKPEECTGGADQSADEVGDGDGDETGDSGDGDGDGEPDKSRSACAAHDDGRSRTVFQCNGKLTVSIAFNTLLGNCAKTLGDPGWCDELHEFGFDIEPYEMPAVMACCDAEGAPEDEILRMCSVDMVDQICLSLPQRIQALLDGGKIDGVAKQARRLRDWLSLNWQECYDALNRQSDVPGRLEKTTWLVNNGNNKGWSLLNNLRITVEEGEVTSASLPDDQDDYLTCLDNTFNNTEYFEGDAPLSPGITSVTRLAEAPDVTIHGPILPAGAVLGVAKLASSARMCQLPWCSSMEIADGAEQWTLVEMELFAHGPASLDYIDRGLTIHRAALRLYGTSHGLRTDDRYLIQAGDAHFVLSGVAEKAAQVRWASNSTPITIRKSGDGWTMESFTVTHLDTSGQAWQVIVPATTWD